MKREISLELIMQLHQFIAAEDPLFCLSSSLIKLSLFLRTKNFIIFIIIPIFPSMGYLFIGMQSLPQLKIRLV